MKYPNTRYGNPVEFEHFIQGQPVELVARGLRRSPRTIQNYLERRQRIPWWVPEILRLQHLERHLAARQMGINRSLGIVRAGQVVPIRPQERPQELPPEIFQLRTAGK